MRQFLLNMIFDLDNPLNTVTAKERFYLSSVLISYIQGRFNITKKGGGGCLALSSAFNRLVNVRRRY